MISVIVPVYNAEKYLEYCLNSILFQSFRDYELILINDGSTDRSGDICETYAGKDKRIKVIHQENRGVSVARNQGILQAKGKYIAFIDGDDYVEKEYLKVLYTDICRCNADIACCDYNEIVDGTCANRNHAVRERRIVKKIEDYIIDYLDRKEFYGYAVWGKLIQKDLLINQSFKKIQYGEDCVYMCELFEKEPICVLNPYAGYNYIRHKESATRSGHAEIITMQHMYCDQALLKLAEQCSLPFAHNRIANRYAQTIYESLSVQVKFNNKKFYKDSYDIICAHIHNAFKFGNIRFKKRMMLHIYESVPNVYWYTVRFILKVTGKCSQDIDLG